MQTSEHRDKTLSWLARGLLTEKNVPCDGNTSGENMKSETWRCVELCIIFDVITSLVSIEYGVYGCES
jgi:hypothetical protein